MHVGQRGIVDRIVVISRRVFVQSALLFGNEVPETSSGLVNRVEVIRIVRGIFPLEEDIHRGGGDGWFTSRIGRVSGRELAMCEVVVKEGFDVVGEEDADLISEGRTPVLYEIVRVQDYRKLDLSEIYLSLFFNELD